MKRMTTICKGAALLLAVALLTLPLLGLAAPAAEARTLDSATVSGNDAPTVGDSATPPTESGDPAPEPPACFCDVKCTATTLNADCPACVADLAACKGKERRNAAVKPSAPMARQTGLALCAWPTFPSARARNRPRPSAPVPSSARRGP